MTKSLCGVLALSLLGTSALARNVDDFLPMQEKYPLYYSVGAASYGGLSPKKSQLKKGTVLVLDTRDRKTCLQIEKSLSSLKVKGQRLDRAELCSPKSNSEPYNVVTLLRDSNEVEFRKELDISGLISSEKSVVTETRNLFLASLGMVGALYLMPESVTKWDKNDARGIGTKWKENVKAGPVVDKDDWAINYIGHPVSGAIYYQVARGLDMSMVQSFGYSAFMSTFFWEYGVEAFAETPSIQDLWSTPILGSLLGEVFYRVEKNLKAQGGTLLGSARLGGVAMILLNPASHLSDKINQAFGTRVVQSAKLELFSKKRTCADSYSEQDTLCESPMNGLRLQFRH